MLDQIAHSPKERLIRLVEQLIVGQSGLRSVSAEDSLTDIGLSSINMVNLMLTVEAEFERHDPAVGHHAGQFSIDFNDRSNARTAQRGGGRLRPINLKEC